MTSTLSDALDHLAAVASEAGLSADDARTEGLQLSATVSEPARGAFRDWAQQTGFEGGAEAFFEYASRGRRWRSGPTVLMSQLAVSNPTKAKAYADALAEVAAAACLVGEPHPQVAGNATLAAAAQRAVVPGATPPVTPQQPMTPSVPAEPAASPTTGQVPDPTPEEQTFLESMAGRSREAADAMGEFTKRAPQMLSNVLSQLKQTQTRMSEAGMRTQPDTSFLDVNPFDLSSLDPHAPGAFGLTGSTPGTAGTQPPVTPAAPGQSSDPAAAPAPVQAAEDPAAPAEEPEPEQPAKTLEELLAELDDLIGLKTVKSEIRKQSAILRVQGLRKKAGLTDPTITRHLIFVGNPGTGKTTVARLVAGIYRALGLLSKGQLVEVDRSELVAGYLGQTAIKTAEVADKAKGGVLFIDEAYSLSGDQYGEEAINTLVKEMEDNRHDLVVIVAGYPRPMAKFIDENPGLSSRFRTTIEFDDYTDDELIGIFTSMATKADYDVTDDTVTAFKVLLAQQVRDETFGNGRFARNVLEAAIGRQAWRLRDVEEPTLEELRTILPEDVAATSDVDTVEFGETEQKSAETDDATAGEAPATGEESPAATGTEGESTPEAEAADEETR